MGRICKFVVFVSIILSCYSAKAVELINPPTEGKQYQTLHFCFKENLGFSNPFDLEANHVELHIQRPDFSSEVLSFFYNGKDNGVEKWEARFTPKQLGLYRFALIINGDVRLRLETPVKSNNKAKQGGLILSPKLGVFEYETGESFRGNGINVCWTDDYEYYFKKMKAAGMNFTRIWMCPWNLSFEWQDTGLGNYNLDTAKRLDRILNLAEKYEIFIILSMDFHGIARKGLGFFRENRWNDNPYNKVNGGPCLKPEEIFTNAAAMTGFKKKYKYIVSRFGHSNYLATWEFYNEADLMAGKAIPINRWHIEMAEYVKSVDVHKRLVTTSSTRNYPEKLVDAFKSPAIDYVQFHEYNSLNWGAYMTNVHETCIEYYQKPIIMGEFGVEFRGAPQTYKLDPKGDGIHNAIWAGWFNETPVIPLSWWWDNYIEPNNMWGIFLRLSKFGNKMDFNGSHLAFKTLDSGLKKSNPNEQADIFVRAIYTGQNCAVWMKNRSYQWSILAEGDVLEPVGDFIQIIPEMVPGEYLVTWYEPQKGKFLDNPLTIQVGDNGLLELQVTSFTKDVACLITAK